MATSTDRQMVRETLAGLAAKTQAKIPALNGRVEKACNSMFKFFCLDRFCKT